MITGQEILDKIEAAFPDQVARKYRYPFILIDIQSDVFADKDEDARNQELAARAGLDDQELQQTLDRLFIRTILRAPSEPADGRSDGERFWLRTLAEGEAKSSDATEQGVRTIHFYGYKGGQARSTLLAFLSNVLATNGWRVLVVDADAEAPSSDIIFRASVSDASASLVGLRAGLELAPLRVVSGAERGLVDLLAFRPSDTRYDLDAAALAMEQALAPSALSALVQSVGKYASSKYDVVLVDHRTGLSPSVLPWVDELPGPIVVFARLDEQWRPSRPHLRALWKMAGDDPGVIVSFKHDSDPLPRYRARVRAQADVLLEDLAAVTGAAGGVADEDKPSGDQISDHWVVWPFDSAFIDGSIPSMKMVSGQTLEAVSELRRLLGLGTTPTGVPTTLHRSGAQDEGDLIQTSALRTLSSHNNYLFVLGRKGTGKTRLVRALVEGGVGEPLLVADDFPITKDIKANWAELRGLASEFKDEPMRLWWLIFTAAIEQPGANRPSFEKRILELATSPLSALIQRARSVRAEGAQRLFLIDGLETTFEQSQILNYISALVQFMSTIDGDELFRARARLQVFLRTDLAVKGYENFEQLSHGRTLTLEWDAQAIMNFVLSRIVALKWFQENFAGAVTKINEIYRQVRAGAVEVEDAESLLLLIFPERLKRLNLKMTTFMRTYFSDDPAGLKSFYPRIYDEFLSYIHSRGTGGKKSEDLEGVGPRRRLSQQLIYQAHEHATTQFLHQVRSELRYLVALDDTELDRLLSALRGTTTPFRLEPRIREMAQKARIGAKDVRAAMEQMLNIGIFEVREGYSGQWRAGRLFKSSLGMLYARGDKSPDRQ